MDYLGSTDAMTLRKRVYYGLYSLQHRGEESAGIASTDGKDIICYKGMGLVSDALKPQTLKSLKILLPLGMFDILRLVPATLGMHNHWWWIIIKEKLPLHITGS